MEMERSIVKNLILLDLDKVSINDRDEITLEYCDELHIHYSDTNFSLSLSRSNTIPKITTEEEPCFDNRLLKNTKLYTYKFLLENIICSFCNYVHMCSSVFPNGAESTTPINFKVNDGSFMVIDQISTRDLSISCTNNSSMYFNKSSCKKLSLKINGCSQIGNLDVYERASIVYLDNTSLVKLNTKHGVVIDSLPVIINKNSLIIEQESPRSPKKPNVQKLKQNNKRKIIFSDEKKNSAANTLGSFLFKPSIQNVVVQPTKKKPRHIIYQSNKQLLDNHLIEILDGLKLNTPIKPFVTSIEDCSNDEIIAKCLEEETPSYYGPTYIVHKHIIDITETEEEKTLTNDLNVPKNYKQNNEDLCCICLTNKAQYKSKPCLHNVVCDECYTPKFKLHTLACPLCRKYTNPYDFIKITL